MSTSYLYKEIVRELMRLLFVEVFQHGNLALLERLFTVDFVDHSAPEQAHGPQGVAAYAAALRVGFPDLKIVINDLIIEGDKIAVRTTWSGTHLGMYEHIAPTGKSVRRTLMQIFSLTEGKIAEEWNEGDSLLSRTRID
jgi:predicted ester cyclase